MSKSPLNKPIVYVIDDDPGFTKLLSVVLAKFGLGVETFSNPDALIQRLTQNLPALCLIDLNFGDKSHGFDLIEKIRKEISASLPLMIVSGTPDSQAIAHAIELGANDYLVKPLNRDLLTAKLLNFLDTQELEFSKSGAPNPVQTEIRVSLAVDASLLAVDEVGILVQSPHLIIKGTALNLEGGIISEICGKPSVLLTVVNASVDPTTGLFHVLLEFDATDETLSAQVRKWISSQETAP